MSVKVGVVYDADVAPEMLVHAPVALVCHCMAPVLPLNESVKVVPEQILLTEGVTVPETETGLTLSVTAEEVEVPQLLVTLTV